MPFPDSPVALRTGEGCQQGNVTLQTSCGLSTGPGHSGNFLWAKTPYGTMRMNPGSRGLLLSLVPDLSLLGLLRGEGELTWRVRTCLCAWNIAVSLLLVVRGMLPSRALFTNLSLCRWPSVDVSFYFTATSTTIFRVISSQV